MTRPPPMTSPLSPEDVAATLTEAQRFRLWSFGAEPRQMGIGMMQFLSGMVEPDGFDHPIFGPHYRLNETGLAVRAILQEKLDAR